MSPAEQQRWSRLRQLLADLKTADLVQPVPMEEPQANLGDAATIEIEELDPSRLEAVKERVSIQGASEEEPQAPPEPTRAEAVEVEVGPPLESIGLESGEAEQSPEEPELTLPEDSESEDTESCEQTFLCESLTAEPETRSPEVRLDWNCTTRAFFESLPYENEQNERAEVPSQNWLSLPTSHFLEHLVPWYGLKDRLPSANLFQLVELATQDAMKRAAQLQRLQTEEVTSNAGHFFRNLNWQGAQKP